MAAGTIAAQVEEMKRSGPDEPDPRMAAFAREQAGLVHAQVPEGVAEVGTRLPDAELLAVDGSLTMKEKHDLEFAVLSDPGLAVARAIGVVTPDYTTRSEPEEILAALDRLEGRS